jgi:hypothetical protein
VPIDTPLQESASGGAVALLYMATGGSTDLMHTVSDCIFE